MAPLTLKPFDDWPPYEDGSMDAGLWCLAAIAQRGECYELKEIAHVCGCSYEWIRQLEEKALKKLKREMRHSTGLLAEKEILEIAHEVGAVWDDIAIRAGAREHVMNTDSKSDRNGKTRVRGGTSG